MLAKLSLLSLMGKSKAAAVRAGRADAGYPGKTLDDTEFPLCSGEQPVCLAGVITDNVRLADR